MDMALTRTINSFRWLGNNLHNHDTQQFVEYYDACLEDAKESMGDDWERIRV